MQLEDFMALQNGSDVRGVALQVPEGLEVTLSGESVNRIAGAFVQWLASCCNKPVDSLRVGVGHDSRVTAQALTQQIADGLAGAGASCFACGLASTPAMYMGTRFSQTAFDGAIMVTASHLPMERNGMKFFTKEGGLDKPDITWILQKASQISLSTVEADPAPSELMPLYTAYLREKIAEGVGLQPLPLAGLHVVVDAGNGAGGFFVHDVLEPLGAICTGSQYLEPDGRFPNHSPNPENQPAMQALSAAVLQNQAHLGFMFDTDVDRMAAVLADGQSVGRDAAIAMLAAILAPEYPGATIVTDSVTSDRLTEFLSALGLVHHCHKRGYRNVINEAKRLNAEGVTAPLAIETSGHGALIENYFLDDGAYLAVKMLVAAAKAQRQGKSLGTLIAALPQAGHAVERRIPIAGEDFAAYGAEVLQAFRQRAVQAGIRVVDSYEGVRLQWPGRGWALLRLSLHEPLLPLNVETKQPDGCVELLEEIAGLLAGFDRLDLRGL
ncbi:phosphomannomutase/phosphoglucomutase [Ruminococcaceae bacterium OttesenSCG-928-I18]|nr:phosphomannomutase/phosphoglucomutase [Ruminococcaceae bacterium OttesenSCG-928-I18]